MRASIGKPSEFWTATAFFLAMAMLGAWSAYAAVSDYAAARASRNWPVVEGVALSRAAGGPPCRYAYFQHGKPYEGARQQFATAPRRSSLVDCSPGVRLDVRVAPDDPALSVLAPGGSAVTFVFWIGAAAIVLFAGLAGVIRMMLLADGLVAMRGDYSGAESPAE